MKFLAVAVWTTLACLIRGATIDTFWTWFVVGDGTPFAGRLPDLTFAQALGLGIVAPMLVASSSGEDNREPAEQAAFFVAYYLVYWVVASAVYLIAFA